MSGRRHRRKSRDFFFLAMPAGFVKSPVALRKEAKATMRPTWQRTTQRPWGVQRFFLSLCLGLGFFLAWALSIQAQGGGPDIRSATLNTAVWVSTPVNLGVFPDVNTPQVVVSSSGALHMVWEEGGRLYHLWRDPQGTWYGPQPIWWGMTPALVIDGYDRVHMVFVQQVRDNYEVYYTYFDGRRWSLPRNVSYTSGQSYSPDIALAPDGTLHVVWNDTTPGRDVVYHAVLAPPAWTSMPVLSAWGKAPVLRIDTSLVMHLLWQGENIWRTLDVFHLLGQANVWRLPQNLSDSQANSVAPQAVLDAANTLHVTWKEETPRGYQVFYTFGREMGWLLPEAVSAPGVMDSGISVSERGTFIHLWWGDGMTWWSRWRALGSLHWSAPVQLLYAGSRPVQVRFAPWNLRQLHALWEVKDSDGVSLWYGRARTPIRVRFFLAQLAAAP